MSKNKKKNKEGFSIGKVIIGALLILLAAIIIEYFDFGTNSIRKVKKVLSAEYYDISCINSDCTGYAAYKGDRYGKSTVKLLNDTGKVVATYNSKYDTKDKMVKRPYDLTDNYFLMKKISGDNETVGYTINDRSGKELYSTENKLTILNKKYVVVEDENERYIITYKGDKKYSNVKKYTKYNYGKLSQVEMDGDYILFDSDGNTILNGYKVADEVKNNGKTLFLIVSDVKTGTYNYFDVNKLKIVGRGFETYTKYKDNKYVVTVSKNTKKVKYILSEDGTQTKYKDSFVKYDVKEEIEKKVDTKKYYIYTSSFYKNNQEKILVDDLENKKFGILNVDTKKFTALYSYKKDANSLYSSVTKINDDAENLFLQISCSSARCDGSKLYVYDMKKLEKLFELNADDLNILYYTQYTKGYKVIKYASFSKAADMKGKYVLYDANNKELYKSERAIVLIDQEKVFGMDYSSNLVLYNAKKNAKVNDEDSTATKVNVDGNIIYKYEKDENTIVLNSKGKKIFDVDKEYYLSYSSSSIIYADDSKVRMYDLKSGKTKTYKLKENEKLNDSTGELIPPYKNTLFINNTEDKYIRIINNKGRTIKNIKQSEIHEINENKKDSSVILITKKTSKNGNLYGLYLAK